MIVNNESPVREDDLKTFVKGTEHFFKHVTRMAAEVSMPFIKESSDSVIDDFSAVIGISGKHRGCVYYTAPREMIGELMGHFGEPIAATTCSPTASAKSPTPYPETHANI